MIKCFEKRVVLSTWQGNALLTTLADVIDGSIDWRYTQIYF